MDQFELTWLLGQFGKWKNITIGLRPEDIGSEVPYTYINHSYQNTETGLSFILSLNEQKTGMPVIINILHVQNIEYNEHSRVDTYCKMYFVIKNPDDGKIVRQRVIFTN